MKRKLQLLTLTLAIGLAGCGIPDGNFTNGGNAYIHSINEYGNGQAIYTIRSCEGNGGFSCKIILPNDFGKVNERVIVISTKPF